MGEFSKRIGENGEDIVKNFLTMVGWGTLNNFDIPSIDPGKHGKKNHGIDGYFHYKSPLISNTLENVLISVKFSTKKYLNHPVRDFKNHYKDLAMAIESFKKSGLRDSSMNNYSGLDKAFDRGLLFWIHNDVDGYDNVIENLTKLQLPNDYNHDGIIVIDNNKMEFFFNSIEYVKNKFRLEKVDFTYFNTSLNSDNTLPKNGKKIPVQYLASGIIPIMVHQNNEKSIVLCCQEEFDENVLLKLIGLIKNITADFQSKGVIAFPNFNTTKHEQVVDEVKMKFEDLTLINDLEVENFNKTFRD